MSSKSAFLDQTNRAWLRVGITLFTWLGLGIRLGGFVAAQDANGTDGTGEATPTAVSIFKDWSKIKGNLPELILTVVLAVVLVEMVQRLLPRLADRVPSRFRLYVLPWAPILRLLILFFAVLIVMSMLLNPTPGNVVAVLGTAGLAIGFAFKDYVSSLIAGIVAIVERPYSVGDWVKIGGDYGQVQGMGMRSLRMVTPDDTAITIPHSRIWTDNIANANGGKRDHLCVADFYVDPNHDVAAARQKLWDVAMTSPFINLADTATPRHVVVIVREEPWATHYRLKAYPIDGRDEFKFTSDLTVQGKAALTRMGVRSVSAPAVPGVGNG